MCVSGGRRTVCVYMCKGGVLEGGQGASGSREPRRLEEGL